MNYVCLHFILMQMSPAHQESSQTCALIIKFSRLWYSADFQSLKTQSCTHIWHCHDMGSFIKVGSQNILNRTVCQLDLSFLNIQTYGIWASIYTVAPGLTSVGEGMRFIASQRFLLDDILCIYEYLSSIGPCALGVVGQTPNARPCLCEA